MTSPQKNRNPKFFEILLRIWTAL